MSHQPDLDTDEPARNAGRLRLLTIRVHEGVVERLDGFVPWMTTSTEVGRIKPGITRSDVLRHALDLGLDMLDNRRAMSELASREERILRRRG